MAAAARLPDLSALATSGALLCVRVTPNARQPGLTPAAAPGQPIRIAVTEVPEDGKATAAATALLARALGVARSRLTLLRGATARDKLFRLD